MIWGIGQWSTWERGRSVDTWVHERLDRYVASPSWSTLFPHATVDHLLKYNSDHSPILLKLHQKPNSKKTQSKAFKFETS